MATTTFHHDGYMYPTGVVGAASAAASPHPATVLELLVDVDWLPAHKPTATPISIARYTVSPPERSFSHNRLSYGKYVSHATFSGYTLKLRSVTVDCDTASAVHPKARVGFTLDVVIY